MLASIKKERESPGGGGRGEGRGRRGGGGGGGGGAWGPPRGGRGGGGPGGEGGGAAMVMRCCELLRGHIRHNMLTGWSYDEIGYTPEMKAMGLSR